MTHQPKQTIKVVVQGRVLSRPAPTVSPGKLMSCRLGFHSMACFKLAEKGRFNWFPPRYCEQCDHVTGSLLPPKLSEGK